MKLIAGPCVIESQMQCEEVAGALKELCATYNIDYVFKSSFYKANRTSKDSYTGTNLTIAGINMLANVRKNIGVKTITDIHDPEDAVLVDGAVDIIQIPALLCRQTALLTAAAKVSDTVMIKKGQFMAPWDMGHVADKIKDDCEVWLCERGTSFGYNNLVVDMRSLVIMREFGHPIIFDATHSTQLPGGNGKTSGGQREMVPYLAKAAMAVGIDGLFMEVHPDPEKALCDAACQYPLHKMEQLLEELIW